MSDKYWRGALKLSMRGTLHKYRDKIMWEGIIGAGFINIGEWHIYKGWYNYRRGASNTYIWVSEDIKLKGLYIINV